MSAGAEIGGRLTAASLSVASWPDFFRGRADSIREAVAALVAPLADDVRRCAAAADALDTSDDVGGRVRDVLADLRRDARLALWGRSPDDPEDHGPATPQQLAAYYRACLAYARAPLVEEAGHYDDTVRELDARIRAAADEGDALTCEALRAVRTEAYPRLPNDAGDFGGFLGSRIGAPIEVYHWRAVRDHAPWGLRAGDVVAFVAEGGALWRTRANAAALPIRPDYRGVLGLEREGVLELAGGLEPARQLGAVESDARPESAAPAAPADPADPALPKRLLARGVYRMRVLRDGRPVLYAVDDAGEIVAMRTVPEGATLGAVGRRMEAQLEDGTLGPGRPTPNVWPLGDPRPATTLGRGVWQAPWTENGGAVLVAISGQGALVGRRLVLEGEALDDATRDLERWLDDANPIGVPARDGPAAEEPAEEGPADGQGVGAEAPAGPAPPRLLARGIWRAPYLAEDGRPLLLAVGEGGKLRALRRVPDGMTTTAAWDAMQARLDVEDPPAPAAMPSATPAVEADVQPAAVAAWEAAPVVEVDMRPAVAGDPPPRRRRVAPAYRVTDAGRAALVDEPAAAAEDDTAAVPADA